MAGPAAIALTEPLVGGTRAARSRPRLFINPWVAFAACAVLQLLSGVQYVVALWASDLKEIFGFSQSQIQGMISPPFVVAVIGWAPGIVYDALARRHRLGPRCFTEPRGFTSEVMRMQFANIIVSRANLAAATIQS